MTKVSNVWAKKGTGELFLMELILMQNSKEKWLVLYKNVCLQAEKKQFHFRKENGKTQLKAECTDLFWKLPGCSLFSQVGIGW